MAHVAGVTTDQGDEGPWTEHCERPVDGLRLFKDDALLFQPGTQYRYSNYGWILVSAAVETAAAEPFFTFMRKQVFEPLGMTDTMADSAIESVPGRAAFYFPRFAADPRYGAQEPARGRPFVLAGSAAFLSTPSDLVRFGMAIDGGTLLQPSTVQLLQTSQRLTTGAETGYGLGWDLETVALAGKDTRMAGHDGEVMGGMLASLMTFPADGIVIAVLSNTSYADTAAAASSIAQPFAEQVRRSARR